MSGTEVAGTAHKIGPLDDLAPGEMRRVEVGGVGVCLARLLDGTVHAINDLCTHEDESLSDGYLDGEAIECPAHASRFDARTGAVSGEPARVPVASYPVRVEDGAVFVVI